MDGSNKKGTWTNEKELLKKTARETHAQEAGRPEYDKDKAESLNAFINWTYSLLMDYQDLDRLLQHTIVNFPEDLGAQLPAAREELGRIRKAKLDIIRDQQNAAEDLDLLQAKIKRQKAEVEKQKKQLERDQKRQAEIENQLTQTGFFNVPTSPESDLILDFLISGGNIADLPGRKKLYSHGATLEVSKKGKITRLTERTKERETIAEVTNIEDVTGNNGNARKMFVLILQKANEQSLYNGILTKSFIVFPLHELVDRGIFKTSRSARQGFNIAMSKLTNFKISIKTTDKTKKKIEDAATDGLRVLFTGSDIKKGQCYVYLNQEMNWEGLTQFYTMIPNYYYSLSDRPADLLYYIFYLARQNAGKISNQGYFTISFRAIQTRLKLPSEVKLNNPQRDIKDVIDKTLEEIEEKNREANYQGLDLLPVVNEESKIGEYLDRGFLKVTISGDLKKSFSDIYQDTKKKQTQAEKRKRQIEDKAKAAALEKKIENAT